MKRRKTKDALELELVNAFNSMGFEAIHYGGAKKPDGVASANLSASEQQQRSYSVSLEAKSKQVADGKVSAKTVGISAIARQRDDFDCDHALVVGPNFPASDDEQTALEKEISDAAHAAQSKGAAHKTITLMRVQDLARLVTLVPQKRIGLPELREFFQHCKMPEESRRWVDELEKRSVTTPPYREILEAVAALQKEQPDSPVKYSALRVEIRHTKQIHLNEGELRTICQGMMQFASNAYLFATSDAVELSQKPEKVLESIEAIAGHALNKNKEDRDGTS